MSAKTNKPGPNLRAGFTLLEIIAGLVVMASLATLFAINFQQEPYALLEESDLLKLRIRYAQSRAMGMNTSYGISCTGSQYFLYRGTSTNNREVIPGNEGDTLSFADGISSSTFVVSFNQWGEPFSDVAQATALANDLSITVSSSSDTQTVTVTPVTGYVP